MSSRSSILSVGEFAGLSNVSRETLERLGLYVSLLTKWQKAINLVAADSLADVWRRHILDSAQLAIHMPPEAKIIADLGSGAGFPGLVLSIILDRPVHLIEASGKKATFLREAARLTRAPALIHQCRIERADLGPCDLIVARALAPVTTLLDYAEPLFANSNKNSACLFLKGSRAEEELTEAYKSWTMSVERLQSVTDPTGIILRIQDIVRDGHSG